MSGSVLNVGIPQTIKLTLLLPKQSDVDRCAKKPLALGYVVYAQNELDAEVKVSEVFCDTFEGGTVVGSINIDWSWKSLTVESHVQNEGEEQIREVAAVTFFPQSLNTDLRLDYRTVAEEYIIAETEEDFADSAQ